MTQLFANNAATVLAADIANTDTSISLSSGTGALFPSPTNGDYFLATLFQRASGVEQNWEVVKCTARSSDTLTVVRAQESTTARAFSSGDPVELRFTANTAASLAQFTKASDGSQLGLAFGTGLSFPLKLTNEIGWRPMGLTNSEGSGGGRTWCYKTVCPDATGFDAVRLTIRHAASSTDTNHKLIVAVTETAAQAASTLSADINRWRPVVGATEYSTIDATEQYGWKSVTWAGVNNKTPAAASTTAPVEYFSDWIPLSSVPRADGGTYPLILIRDLVTGTTAASSFAADTVNMNTATAANGGLIMQSGWTANDFVTTINNLNSANPVGALSGGVPVIGIEFRTRKAGVSLLGVGDSLAQNATVVADGFSSFGLRTAAVISALGIPCGYVNNGFASHTMTDFTATGLTAIAAWAPNAVICQGISPNGPVTGGYTTDAKMRYSVEQQTSMVQSQITAARAVGARVFLTTGIPMPSATLPNASQDAMRLAMNTRWMTRARDITPVDFDALVTDGATPARIKTAAAYESGAGNGLHVNETYVALEANLITTAVKQAFGIT